MKKILVAVLLLGCSSRAVSRGEEEVPEDAGRDVIVLEGGAGDAEVCDGYLSFDGTEGSYVRIPNMPDLQPPFTVEGWFKLDEGQNRVDFLKRCLPENTGWGMSFVTDQTGASIFGKMSYPTYLPLEGTGWRHLAWTHDGVTSKMFLDGFSVGSRNTPDGTVSACDEPLTIGVQVTANGELVYNAGSVDELRVSNVIRYTENFEPAERHETDASTLGLWHFDGDLADSSESKLLGESVGSGSSLGC